MFYHGGYRRLWTQSFCTEAPDEAIELYGRPEIFNTDQSSQFTSEEFTSVLKNNDIKISMDGKGRWVDNVFVERSLGNYFVFYNRKRRHQSLEKQTPDTVYNQAAVRMAA